MFQAAVGPEVLGVPARSRLFPPHHEPGLGAAPAGRGKADQGEPHCTGLLAGGEEHRPVVHPDPMGQA